MKKLFLSAFVAVAFVMSVNAQQGFSVGLHAGVPTGDTGDFYGFNIGVDASYLFAVVDGFDVGFTTGYSHFTGKDDLDGTGYIPLAGTARYGFGEDWFFGADLGYALSTADGGDGGVLYQPKIGWRNEKIDVYGFYKGISKDGNSTNAFGVGVGFHLQ